MADSYENLRRTDEGGIATVALARPDTRNALSAGLIEELARCFGEIAYDDGVRVVVLTGEGRSFCGGADIGYMRRTAEFSFEENVEDARRLAAMFAAVDGCPKPVVANASPQPARERWGSSTKSSPKETSTAPWLRRSGSS
jgi:methylglutaconyl-CoA hydratase